MPLNFPNSPTLNQIYTSNTKSWQWNGVSWISLGTGGGGGSISPSTQLEINSLGVNTAAPTQAGEIRATNNITAYYSDARLKDFLGSIPNALEKIQQLTGYYFTENEIAKTLGYNNPNRQVGVSAQEVQNVMPEIVVPAPIDEKYLTVQYEKLIPLLIEGMKEMQSQINNLNQKLEK